MTAATTTELGSSTYEILQNRLQQQTQQLRERLQQLNQARQEVFGAIETKLIATERIHTEHNCVPYDMVPLDTKFLFGYNVHLGLKTAVELSDVFSVYDYQEHSFRSLGYELLDDATFAADFQKLYKYYKDTKFIRFVRRGTVPVYGLPNQQKCQRPQGLQVGTRRRSLGLPRQPQRARN